MELLRGVIHGRTIELDSESGLPDGQRVAVAVRPLVSASSAALLQRAFGAWADDAGELDQFLAWNRLQRREGRSEIEQCTCNPD
jgi:hypothetical protein